MGEFHSNYLATGIQAAATDSAAWPLLWLISGASSQFELKEDETQQPNLNFLCSVILDIELSSLLLSVSFPVCQSSLILQGNTVEEEHRLGGQTPWVQVLISVTHELCDLGQVTYLSCL